MRACQGRTVLLFVLFAAALGALEVSSAGCSSRAASSATTGDAAGEGPDAAGTDSPAPQADALADDADAGVIDGGAASPDASAPFVTSMAIVTTADASLQGAPGDAIPLAVLLSMSDGTTQTVPADQVTWLAPATLVAEDPNNPGPDILPDAGAEPTAFFVQNPFRQTNPGVLYVVDPGVVSSPTIAVRASVMDAGEISAAVAILPAPTGDATRGAALFQQGPECGTCHGAAGGGSPPALLPDGGAELIDGGTAYSISGQLYAYPAPGLYDAPDSGNLAFDPSWNAALLGMASQADIDNRGVALRMPMPDWFGGTNGSGGTLSGQDFADIYAWLKTQTN